MRIKRSVSVLIMLIAVSMLNVAAFPADDPVTSKAADFICIKAKEGGKTRLAVYPFTGKDGSTSTDTEKYATGIIAVILTKGDFRVIDPSRVSKIVEEQEKGLTGLVDPDTAPETGRMLGADAMIFGIAADGALQIRILDAETGEIIGATVADAGGTAKISSEEFKSKESKDRFLTDQMEVKLAQLSRDHPGMFLYVTADSAEMKEFEAEFPRAAGQVSAKLGSRNSAAMQRFEKRKTKLLQLRQKDSAFDKRIKDMREKVYAGMQEKKRKIK